MTAVVFGCVSVAAVVATLATLHSNNRPAAVLRLRRSALFGRGCLRSFLARTVTTLTTKSRLNAFSSFFLVCHRSPLQATSSGGMSNPLNKKSHQWKAATHKVSPMHYYVQQGERHDGHLRFMYRPFMETLKPLEDRVFVYSSVVNLSAVPAGSTFVWVGVHLVACCGIPPLPLRVGFGS